MRVLIFISVVVSLAYGLETTEYVDVRTTESNEIATEQSAEIETHSWVRDKDDEQVEGQDGDHDSDDGDDTTMSPESLMDLLLPRGEKSLLNTYPFSELQNQQHHDAGHHGHHDEHHGEHHGEHAAALHGDEHHHEHHPEANPVAINPFNSAIRSPFTALANGQNLIQDSRQQSPFAISNRLGSSQKSANDDDDEDANILSSAAAAQPDESGKRCVDKVMMQNITVFQDIEHCEHSYERRCHPTFKTVYEPYQEEECEDNFEVVCRITFEKSAFNETIEVCSRMPEKDCDIPGEEDCRVDYRSECWKKQHEHEVQEEVPNCKTVYDEKCHDVTVGYTTEQKCDKWPRQECTVETKTVKKWTPVVGCNKLPVKVCVPGPCGIKLGEEECREEQKTVVVDKPVESCTIEPVPTCKFVTKQLPQLKQVEECADVPKEICYWKKGNPKVETKPLIKRWCYVPSKESGLL